MDERAAWNQFKASGKVEDYIRFRQLKNEETAVNDVVSDDKKDNEKAGKQAWLNRFP